jgi:putative membrane protein
VIDFQSNFISGFRSVAIKYPSQQKSYPAEDVGAQTSTLLLQYDWLAMHGEAVLKRFSLAADDLLGSGGESQVYALDEERILRLYRERADPEYVASLHEFYRALDGVTLPFSLPYMEEVGDVDGALYAVEKRLPGVSFTQYLKQAGGDARSQSLANYLAAAAQIQTIPINLREFGELLTSNPTQRPAWPEYLAARAHEVLSSYSHLSADVPALDGIVRSWEKDLEMVADVAKPTLAHGDYFPGNVMVDENGEVTAVIDFSPTTVAGDPKLDLACALIFVEVDAGYRPDDSPLLARLLRERDDAPAAGVIALYRTFYSFYFSGAKKHDPPLYEWCVANLAGA